MLLAHGADPNAGYLSEGLSPPFIALTGAFGQGEGDRDRVQHLLVRHPAFIEQAIAEFPDQLVRAAQTNSVKGVALLIDLGFDVNAINREERYHERRVTPSMHGLTAATAEPHRVRRCMWGMRHKPRSRLLVSNGALCRSTRAVHRWSTHARSSRKPGVDGVRHRQPGLDATLVVKVELTSQPPKP